MSYLEISLRMFFTSDEADVAPKVIVVIDQEKIGATDWSKVVEGLRSMARERVKDIPLENLREMNNEEITAYRADENEES